MLDGAQLSFCHGFKIKIQRKLLPLGLQCSLLQVSKLARFFSIFLSFHFCFLGTAVLLGLRQGCCFGDHTPTTHPTSQTCQTLSLPSLASLSKIHPTRYHTGTTVVLPLEVPREVKNGEIMISG